MQLFNIKHKENKFEYNDYSSFLIKNLLKIRNIEESEVIITKSSIIQKDMMDDPNQTKLIISHNGDSSVGMDRETWIIDVPFNVNEVEWSDLEDFREAQKHLYQDYTDFKLIATYSYEQTND